MSRDIDIFGWARRKLNANGLDEWEEYEEQDRQFLRSTIRSLLLDRELWEAAFQNADNNLMTRCAEICE
jgi:hypothetical protein